MTLLRRRSGTAHEIRILRFAAALAFVFALSSIGLQAETYTATTKIEIASRGLISLGAGPDPINDQVENEIEVMGSPDVLSPVITDLRLDAIWAKRLGAPSDHLGMQEALDHLRQVLKFTPVPNTGVVSITVTSENPVEAPEIANAIADRYKAMRDNAEKQMADIGERVLRDQITQQQKIVADTSAAAAKNPQDAEAQNKAAGMKSLLDALKAKLKQVLEDEKTPHSPVLILSRSVSPVT